MRKSQHGSLRASLAFAAGLALLALRAGPGALGQNFDEDSLPADMEDSSTSTNPYVPPPGVKLRANTVIANWEATPRRLAHEMLDHYGEPDGVTPRALSWHHRGPWECIVVRQDAAPHNFPSQHNDWLEETIRYKVPLTRLADLAAFDGSLLVDRTRGELTARSDSEGGNYAALNLADEIVNGKKNASQARLSLAQASGKSSPYAQGLMFARQENAADADQSAPNSE